MVGVVTVVRAGRLNREQVHDGLLWSGWNDVGMARRGCHGSSTFLHTHPSSV